MRFCLDSHSRRPFWPRLIGGLLLCLLPSTATTANAAIIGGQIESIAADGSSITVVRSNGSKQTFRIQATTRITFNSKTSQISKLKTGMAVSVYTSSTGAVLKINARNAAQPNPKTTPNSPRTRTPRTTQTPDSEPKSDGSAGQVTPGDWPQFRGPQRDNRSAETGLLQRWPDGGPQLLWVADGLGEGYSSVSISDGRVYTMGNLRDEETVFALNLESGQKLWSARNANAYRQGAGNGPRSTPTVDGERVYVLGGAGELGCFDVNSGNRLWGQNILQQYGGQNIQWGICESVLIDGEKLVCTPGGQRGTMVALNKTTGQTLWTSQVPGAPSTAYASPVICEVGGVKQYVNFTSRGVVGVRAEDGAALWGDDGSSNGTANCSSVLIADNLVFSSSNYGTGAALVRLQAGGGRVQAQQVYQTKDMKNHHGGMVLVDGFVYGSNDGILTCLELTSGRVAWRERTGKGSVVYADGRIIFRSERGPVRLVGATPESYQEFGQFDQPQRSNRAAWPHPVVAQGKLFLRDQDKLLCYQLR